MGNEPLLRGALVTGASHGIGAATARELARLGYGVGVNYLTSDDAAFELVADIERSGGRAMALHADVRDPDAVRELVARTAEAFGGLQVLINNVGSSKHSALEDLSLEMWHDALASNLTSTFLACKAALPYLRQAPWGRIVNLASLRAMSGSDHGAHYAAAKAGVIGLTKSLARELAPRITVNAIAPGYTRTEMTRASLARDESAIVAQIPVRRVAEPEEIARLIGFLASEGSGYITGETINQNGGIYMQ
ncbi:MAG: 3-oxoacyl-ACP reductase family protein [Candidatus Bipolaricaulota bacterium]